MMRCLRHAAVLPLLASFTDGKLLWMVTPYYSGGSLHSIMEYSNPQVIAKFADIISGYGLISVQKSTEYHTICYYD